VKSCDPVLQTSVEEVIKYLQTYNTRPLLFMQCHGYHTETRQVKEHYTDKDGHDHTRYRTETYTVTDFDYKVDITQYIFPFGYMQSVDGDMSIPDIVKAYHKDKNCLKSLQMMKEIDFDFSGLKHKVEKHFRGKLHWHRGLQISFPRMNHSVRVWQQNCCSSIWENCCLRCLVGTLTVGVYCCIAYCIQQGHKQSGIRSFWRIEYSSGQVFHEHVKDKLWTDHHWGGGHKSYDSYGNSMLW